MASETPANISEPATTTESTIRTVSDIPKPSELWFKIHVFIYDLEEFKTNADSRDCINNALATDSSYISEPYFTQEECEMLKNLIIDGKKTLKE